MKKKNANKSSNNDTNSEYADEAEPVSFQRQALEIKEPDGDFDPNAEPQNGEEFLTWMLYERRNIPSVVVKNPKTMNSDNSIETLDDSKSEKPISGRKMLHQTVLQNEEECASYGLEYTRNVDNLQTPEWKTIQVEDFLKIRSNINTMRQTLAESSYDNEIELPIEEDVATWRQFCHDNEPLLSIMLRFSEPQLEFLLDLISEWLQPPAKDQTPPVTSSEPMDLPNDSNAAIPQNAENSLESHSDDTHENVISKSDEPMQTSTAENALDLDNDCLFRWLYAVLACLHFPLEPAVHSKLREIARICIRQRAQLQLPQQASQISSYNLFIYLIAKVFEQLDLASYV